MLQLPAAIPMLPWTGIHRRSERITCLSGSTICAHGEVYPSMMNAHLCVECYDARILCGVPYTLFSDDQSQLCHLIICEPLVRDVLQTGRKLTLCIQQSGCPVCSSLP